jgi:hypothetical protein
MAASIYTTHFPFSSMGSCPVCGVMVCSFEVVQPKREIFDYLSAMRRFRPEGRTYITVSPCRHDLVDVTFEEGRGITGGREYDPSSLSRHITNYEESRPMTEHDWLTSTDPAAMLRWLTAQYQPDPKLGLYGGTPIATDRKLRLFACACCRLAWDGTPCPRCGGKGHFFRPSASEVDNCRNCQGSGKVGGLTDPRSRNAVEVAERYADGLATDEEMNAANEAARLAWGEIDNPSGLARYAVMDNIAYAAQRIAAGPFIDLPDHATQAALLRDIFGNPFRPVMLDELVCDRCGGNRPSNPPEHINGFVMCADCLKTRGKDCGILKKRPARWLTPAVVAIARAIYEERRWQDMVILGDALEEAGCDNPDILNHCRWAYCGVCKGTGQIAVPWTLAELNERRNPHVRHVIEFGPKPRYIPCVKCHGNTAGPHARGCWVLDLFLGKE